MEQRVQPWGGGPVPPGSLPPPAPWQPLPVPLVVPGSLTPPSRLGKPVSWLGRDPRDRLPRHSTGLPAWVSPLAATSGPQAPPAHSGASSSRGRAGVLGPRPGCCSALLQVTCGPGPSWLRPRSGRACCWGAGPGSRTPTRLGSLGLSFPLRRCLLPAGAPAGPWGSPGSGGRTGGCVPGTGQEGGAGQCRCQAGCSVPGLGTRAHLGSLVPALGLLPHLFQLLQGPGELLLQQPPLCFFQRQGLAAGGGGACDDRGPLEGEAAAEPGAKAPARMCCVPDPTSARGSPCPEWGLWAFSLPWPKFRASTQPGLHTPAGWSGGWVVRHRDGWWIWRDS